MNLCNPVDGHDRPVPRRSARRPDDNRKPAAPELRRHMAQLLRVTGH